MTWIHGINEEFANEKLENAKNIKFISRIPPYFDHKLIIRYFDDSYFVCDFCRFIQNESIFLMTGGDNFNIFIHEFFGKKGFFVSENLYRDGFDINPFRDMKNEMD